MDAVGPRPITRRSLLQGVGALSASSLLSACTGAGGFGSSPAAVSNTPAPPTPPAPYDIAHVLMTGQSLSTGDQSQPVLTLAQPFQNLMFSTNLLDFPSVNALTNGATSIQGVPLTATLTGNPAAQNAETLGNGFADSIVAATALTAPLHPTIRTAKQYLVSNSGVPGYVYTQLAGPTDAPPIGTGPFQEMMSQVRSAQALAAAAGKSYFVPCVVIVHGEFDDYNPNYLTDLLHWQADIQAGVQAITGQTNTIPAILTQTCEGDLGGGAPYAQWQAAVQYPDRFILAGPEYQLPHNPLGDPYHLSIHLRAVGQRMMGAMVARAYRRVFLEGGAWTPVSPAAVTINGTKVVIDYHVPDPPLVLDTTWCTDPGNFGFDYVDYGPAAIISAAVTAPTQVTLTLNNPATPGPHMLNYAYPNTDPLFGPTSGTRGCLRDSSTSAGYYDATDAVPSYNFSIRWGGIY